MGVQHTKYVKYLNRCQGFAALKPRKLRCKRLIGRTHKSYTYKEIGKHPIKVSRESTLKTHKTQFSVKFF